MHNDITLANTTRGISLYIHLSIRSIASQQANGKNTSEAHHQPAQAICSTYLLPYINIKKAVKPLGITALIYFGLTRLYQYLSLRHLFHIHILRNIFLNQLFRQPLVYT